MRQKTYCLYPVVEDTLAGSLLRQRQLCCSWFGK